MGKDNQNKPDQTISIANHENVRGNYKGFAVPVYPVSRNRIYNGCFGNDTAQKNKGPMLRLGPACSRTLYKNIGKY